MTELDRACEQAHYLPDPIVPVPPWSGPPSVAWQQTALVRSDRSGFRWDLVVATAVGAAGVLAWLRVVDRG